VTRITEREPTPPCGGCAILCRMATEYVVRPHEGVGAIRLGASRGEARAAMPEVPVAFGKGPGDTPVDAWHDFGLQVFYDDEDRVEYIEVSRDPDLRPLLFGEPVLSLPICAAVDVVSRHAPHDAEDPRLPECWTFPALDLSLWKPPDGEDDDGCFATIGAGRRGYFATGGAGCAR
jgi:hypothetical protein